MGFVAVENPPIPAGQAGLRLEAVDRNPLRIGRRFLLALDGESGRRPDSAKRSEKTQAQNCRTATSKTMPRHAKHADPPWAPDGRRGDSRSRAGRQNARGIAGMRLSALRISMRPCQSIFAANGKRILNLWRRIDPHPRA